MGSVNKFIGIGNVCKEIEVRYSKSGTAISNFSIACNENYKDRDGKKQEKTEFINIVAFGKLAEIIGEYVQKGQKIYIEGKFTTDTYEKNGEKRYASKIVANNMTMLGGSSGGKQENPSQGSHGSQGDDFEGHPDGCECPECLDIPF